MAAVRTKSVVVLLSALVAGIFVVTVLPRWRAASTVSGKKQQSKPSALYIEKVKAVDKQALWKPRDQVANMQAIALASEEHGDSEGLRPGGVESDNIQDQLLNSQVSSLLTVEKFKQLAVLMHQSQGPGNDRKKVVAIPRNKEPQSLKSMSDDEDSLKVMGVSGRQPASDFDEKQHDSPKPAPAYNVERPHRPVMPGTDKIPTRKKESRSPPRPDSGDSATRKKDHYKPTKPPTPALSTTVRMATPHLTAATSLPFMVTRGSVEIRPERLPPPAHSSDIYFSLLTASKFHNLRFSYQYLTWLQTVDPKQVTIKPTCFDWLRNHL